MYQLAVSVMEVLLAYCSKLGSLQRGCMESGAIAILCIHCRHMF